MKLEAKTKAVKEVKSYGHLNLSSKEFPAIKDLTLGEDINITVTVNINSLRAPDMWEIANNHANPKDINAGFIIKNVEFAKKPATKK